MVIDTSALLAVLFDEPEREQFVRAIGAANHRYVSAGTVVEATIVAESRRGDAAGRELDLFLYRAAVEVVAVDEEQALLARDAWRRYGKGRHPAGLNFGDLFSYALARANGDVLLFKGEDFSETDVTPASPLPPWTSAQVRR
jgi:ribonuclease VapC